MADTCFSHTQQDSQKKPEAYLSFNMQTAPVETGTVFVFAHDLGGGADRYLDTQCRAWLDRGNRVFILRYIRAGGYYSLSCLFLNESIEVDLADWAQLESLLGDCAIGQIIVNELVTYPALFARLSDIRAWKRKKKARLSMLIHDYFAVSPAYNLVSPQDWVYAREGDGFHCDRFYEQDGWAEQYDCPSVAAWRQRWESFLMDCDEVRCFSQDSRRIMSCVYPKLKNITVIPPVASYLSEVHKEGKTTGTLNIGVLGTLTRQKGRVLVQELYKLLEHENPEIKIILIGCLGDGETLPVGTHFDLTGPYKAEDLPQLVLQKDIDLFLMPSICPEAFSHTTEEIIKMGLPLACLDIGAPAERVRMYDKGLILSSVDPKMVFMEIVAFARALHLLPNPERRSDWQEPLTQSEQRLERERTIRRELLKQQNLQFAAKNRMIQDQQAYIEELAAQMQDLIGLAQMQQTQIVQLQEQSRQLQESFDTISNATCWKMTKPVRAALDLVKRSQGNKNAPLRRESKGELSRHATDNSAEWAPLSVDGTVSVIIPTFNGGKDLAGLLELLNRQVDVREIEIVVVDSGSTDDTLTIAADFGAKIIQSIQAEFSHSFARNLGAKHASGEYLLFMTQDAKPSSERWVRDMAQPILTDTAVAVSCKEMPRDDCDLLGRFLLWIHAKYMGILEQNRTLSMPEIQDYDSMRRNGQLDNVACMIRRDVFSQFEFRGSFAEDLELGLRLIRQGYRLSLESHAFVVHSHNRPAFYYLKRCFVDRTTMKRLLPDYPMEYLTADTVMNRITGMTAAVWRYVSVLTKAENVPTQRRRFFAWSRRFFDAERRELQRLSYADFGTIIEEKPPFCDEEFHSFVQKLYARAAASFCVDTHWLDRRRNSILKDLEDYLAYTGEPFTTETLAQIAELFVKHCGQAAGETLACYTQTHGQEASFLNEWVLELRRGV